MPELYLGTWEMGADGWQGPGGNAIGSLDLRGDSAIPGPGLFVYAGSKTHPNLILALGSDLDRELSISERQDMRGMLGIMPQPGSLRKTLYDLWNVHPGAAWKPVMPTGTLAMELYLPGFGLVQREPFTNFGEFPRIIPTIAANYRALATDVERQKYLGALMLQYHTDNHRQFIPPGMPPLIPIPPSTQINENWDCADSGAITCQLTWTVIEGDLDISGNEVVTVGTGRGTGRADSDLSTDNHYSQADETIATGSTGSRTTGVIARKDATATLTYYESVAIWDTLTLRLRKRVAGTFTTLVSVADATLTLGAFISLKVEVNGSTIKLFKNGVEQLSTTDTAITGNLRCGVSGLAGTTGNARIDNFQASDLTAIPVMMNSYRKRRV